MTLVLRADSIGKEFGGRSILTAATLRGRGEQLIRETPVRSNVIAATLALAIGVPGLLVGQRSSTPIVPKPRDSAGVRILDHTADALDRAPLLSLAPGPMAIIGKNDTTIDLSKVYSEVLVLRDGSVVFFVDGSVQVVTPDGSRRQRIGRAGAGPQEFRSADIARGRGDTILVTDAGELPNRVADSNQGRDPHPRTDPWPGGIFLRPDRAVRSRHVDHGHRGLLAAIHRGWQSGAVSGRPSHRCK